MWLRVRIWVFRLNSLVNFERILSLTSLLFYLYNDDLPSRPTLTCHLLLSWVHLPSFQLCWTRRYWKVAEERSRRLNMRNYFKIFALKNKYFMFVTYWRAASHENSLSMTQLHKEWIYIVFFSCRRYKNGKFSQKISFFYLLFMKLDIYLLYSGQVWFVVGKVVLGRIFYE